ncbi:HutD/Ves family protein [Trinickia sp.]|uniref:HutD/Ves family protein n=1 Tax=Trinickia sp. TaxID=2571163 RepID=UPI003F7D90B6
MSGPSQGTGRPRAAGSRAPHPSLRIVRGDALIAAPWKNGGGVTREIAAYPVGAGLDTFVWRLSVADVERPGPFSRFPGVERTLVLLDGEGMSLIERGDGAVGGGRTHALTRPFDIARFDGEAAFDAELVRGATRDFNLMVRRGQASATLRVWRGASARPHTLDADTALVFCARGELEVGFPGAPHQRAMLTAMDTLVLDTPRGSTCETAGEGVALAVLIRYA